MDETLKNDPIEANVSATFELSDFQSSATAPTTALKNGRSEADAKAPFEASDFQFEEQDWQRFLYIGTLPQMAGVPARNLRRLVLKELADNALDAGNQAQAQVKTGRCDRRGEWYFVQDDGKGIDPAEVPNLFSVNRPYTTTKLWRLPMRGAMGNGLRVVAGAVAASRGSLRVYTKNRLLVLRPRRSDGRTAWRSFPADFPVGTRVEVRFGDAIPDDPDALWWAEQACEMASYGHIYKGETSPHWYDGESFYRLLQAAGPKPVRQFIERLKGCKGAKAGKIAAPYLNIKCNRMSAGQAAQLLQIAKDKAQPVKPNKLGAVGPLTSLWDAYAIKTGKFHHGTQEPKAVVPFVVEAWVNVYRDRRDDADVMMCINKTAVIGEVYAYKEKSKVDLRGCGIYCDMKGPAVGYLDIMVNIITPYCPITTTGKQPDLRYFSDAIEKAVTAAINKAKNLLPKTDDGEKQTFKAIVLANLDAAIADASSNGRFRFGQRQLYYKIRPHVPEGAELKYDTFTQIITDYENENGEIVGMVREPRGSLYHPHTGETIYLGTLSAEKYNRPPWTFNKLLYIEKEGGFDALKASKWPERHDCALASAKGYTNRAIKDIIDGFADDGEPITIYCVHDADAEGSMIYQTLVEATKARPKRRVKVINLGMDPWEAQEMGLEVEARSPSEKERTVANYILERRDGPYWKKRLQTERVELDAMTTEEFIAWLDRKMEEHGSTKLVPPPAVAHEEMVARATYHARRIITEKVLREARVEEQVHEAVRSLPLPAGEDLVEEIEDWFPDNEDRPWRDYVDDLARDLVEPDE